MYLELLHKFEKEVVGEHIGPKRHDARFEFALWLEKNAAQHSVQRTATTKEWDGGSRPAGDKWDNFNDE